MARDGCMGSSDRRPASLMRRSPLPASAPSGGLGKMPGFYYTAQLDCVEEQSLR